MGSNFIKISLCISAFLVVLIASNSVFIVEESKQCLVLQLGRVERQIKKSGLYFKIPIIQNLVFFDKRIIDISFDSKEVIAADQKRFIVDSYAEYKIVDPLKFYQTVRNESGLENRLGSIIESHIREKIGNVSLIELLNEARSKVMDLILQGVSKESEKFGVEMIDVRIKRADLPEENSAAIFRRMQTEREKEAKEIRAQGEESAQKIKSEADLQKRTIVADAKRKAQVILGEGERKASQIYNVVLAKDPEFFDFYRTMQAYRRSLLGDKTKVILSPNNSFMNLFNKKKR